MIRIYVLRDLQARMAHRIAFGRHQCSWIVIRVPSP